MHTKPLDPLTVKGAALGAALLLFAPVAQAQPVDVDADADADAGPAPARRLAPGLALSLRIEPGLSVAISEPQSQMTEKGFGQTLKVMFGLGRYLAIGPAVTFTTLPATPAMTDAGTSWAAGAGARLMRPHDASPGHRGLRAASPWLDGDLMYVRTGPLDRLGFAAAIGAAVPLDGDRRVWLGPFVRYSQILQGERTDYDNRDAKVLTVGLSLEVGTGLERRRAPTYVAVDDGPPPEPTPIAPVSIADRDGDGIADGDDRCPDVVGVAASAGCPPYEQVVVQPDKLELRQHIAFGWDSARLDDTSYALLDEVAKALTDNRAVKVQIDGHASSDGADPHNQALSQARADAVREYLITRGVAADRLSATGFSSSVPSQDNDTRGGRVANRRVEFVVSFIIVQEGNTP